MLDNWSPFFKEGANYAIINAYRPNPRKKILCEIFFQEPPIDRRHRPIAVVINELVSSSIISLLDDVWAFPFGLELALCLVRDNDGAPEYEHQFAFLENSPLYEFVVGSHHVLTIQLQVLEGVKTLLF